MELRHLRYFVMVAEERHITRAAARLGIQQPPLSMQIQKLEIELGAKLLRRTAHGVEVTPAGQTFLDDAKGILQAVDRAAARTAQVASGHRGSLSIGFTTSAILHPLVTQIIRCFRQAYPDVSLDVHEDNAAELTKAVGEGALSAALLRLAVSRPPSMTFLELLQEDLLVVLPAGHPLAKKNSPELVLRDLAEEPFILVRKPGAAGLYENIVKACRAAGFEPTIAAEVPHMLTNISLVAAGVGISVVPASLCGIMLQGLRYRRLHASPPLSAPLTLAYITANVDPILENMVAIARELGVKTPLEQAPMGQL